MVLDMRVGMRKFISVLSRELILKIKISMLIKDMDISMLVVYKQQVEEEKKPGLDRGKVG